MTSTLKNRIQAAYTGIVIVTPEEDRAAGLVQSVCKELRYHFRAWTCTNRDKPDIFELLPSLISNLPDKCVMLLHDMHLFLAEPNPVLYRLLKDALRQARPRQICLVCIMPVLKLPADLERHFSVIDLDLPTPRQLSAALEDLCHDTNEAGETVEVRKMPQGAELEALLDAAAGLTIQEAEDAFALSLVTLSCFDPAVVLREKAATLKKNGLVEYVEPTLTLDDVGGWDAYKADLLQSRDQFTAEAAAYHLEPRKGVLLVGQAGNGKSLCAPITGAVFGLPVLRVNFNNLGGSLYGQTEANWRSVMTTARALKKCVIYGDEIDGLTSGAKSSGSTDGGTTDRLVKNLLQDIQDSTGIFFVFTANDIDHLPDPLIDRLEVWSVDLPNEQERAEIWSIHIYRRQRDPKSFDLVKLAKASAGFSGRQIERAWLATMTAAFNDGRREPTTEDALTVCAKVTPTSVTMKDAIEARRKRLEGKARPVSTPTTQSLITSRKIAA